MGNKGRAGTQGEVVAGVGWGKEAEELSGGIPPQQRLHAGDVGGHGAGVGQAGSLQRHAKEIKAPRSQRVLNSGHFAAHGHFAGCVAIEQHKGHFAGGQAKIVATAGRGKETKSLRRRVPFQHRQHIADKTRQGGGVDNGGRRKGQGDQAILLPAVVQGIVDGPHLIRTGYGRTAAVDGDKLIEEIGFHSAQRAAIHMRRGIGQRCGQEGGAARCKEGRRAAMDRIALGIGRRRPTQLHIVATGGNGERNGGCRLCLNMGGKFTLWAVGRFARHRLSRRQQPKEQRKDQRPMEALLPRADHRGHHKWLLLVIDRRR